jgi:hypothetical protein
LDSKGALERINRMVKSIGIKLEYMNECLRDLKNVDQMKKAYVELSTDIVNLWLNVITAFRNCDLFGPNSSTWAEITTNYKAVIEHLEQTTERISRIVKLTDSKAHKDEFERLQAFLKLESGHGTEEKPASAPASCHMLPWPKNGRFSAAGPK